MGHDDWFVIGLMCGWMLQPISTIVQKIISNAWEATKKDQKK